MIECLFLVVLLLFLEQFKLTLCVLLKHLWF
jgi:hypothetical protein